MITRPMVSTRVNFTSCIDSRMVSERSYSRSIPTAPGIWARNRGNSFLTLSTTWMVLVPG